MNSIVNIEKITSVLYGAGVGILIGIAIALGCLTIALIAAHPWVPIVALAALYGGAMVHDEFLKK